MPPPLSYSHSLNPSQPQKQEAIPPGLGRPPASQPAGSDVSERKPTVSWCTYNQCCIGTPSILGLHAPPVACWTHQEGEALATACPDLSLPVREPLWKMRTHIPLAKEPLAPFAREWQFAGSCPMSNAARSCLMSTHLSPLHDPRGPKHQEN